VAGRKIAVIGSGISGLTAGYILSGTGEVTLFEADRRPGGHADTHFQTHFALPLVAAVWSCPAGTALRYPARYLFAFLANHGMLSVAGSPPWRTVIGGSRCYVERAAGRLACVRPGSTPRGAWTPPPAAPSATPIPSSRDAIPDRRCSRSLMLAALAPATGVAGSDAD
jgi:predicted NAD/FAD-binding protein